MGGGCGPEPSELDLSVPRYYLAATTITCNDGNSYALFGGGSGSGGVYNDVDVINCKFDQSTLQLQNARSYLAATTITCNDGNSYALFGGGRGILSRNVYNDVDVFECCDVTNNIQYKTTLHLQNAREGLEATTITCNDGKSYALFGGGYSFDGNDTIYYNDVDVFECCDGTIVYKEKVEWQNGRSLLAATTITCPDGKSYALFGGGYSFGDSGATIYNDVDVFECCDGTIVYKEKVELSSARRELAATTITCPDGKSYALFGGGLISSGGYSNDVDVFECCDGTITRTQTLHLQNARRDLAATTITCPDGKSYALFGGGYSFDGNDSSYYNDVDVFECCDVTNDIQYKTTLQLSSGRSDLAATTFTDCCNKEYALFGGGDDGNSYSNTVNLFDCTDIS